MALTLRQLKYYLSLAETGSFTRAAEICHVTPSTLSAGIAELEEILQQKLFVRTTRKLIATPAGNEIYSYAKSIIESSMDLERAAQRPRGPLVGKWVLGVIPTIASYILPRFLPQLQEDYPKLDLYLKEDLTSRQLNNLRNREVDAVLMALPYDTPDMHQMELWSESFILARPAIEGKNSDRKANIEDLKNEPLLLLDDGHCLRDHILSVCQFKNTTTGRGKALGATSLQTLVQMVAMGYGVTLLPEMATYDGTLPKGVMLQEFEEPQPKRKIGLCWRAQDPRFSELLLLGDFIRQNANPKKYDNN